MNCPFCNFNMRDKDSYTDDSLICYNCDYNTYIRFDEGKNIIFWDAYFTLNDKIMILESSKIENHTELSSENNFLVKINEYTNLELSVEQIYEVAKKLYNLSLY